MKSKPSNVECQWPLGMALGSTRFISGAAITHQSHCANSFVTKLVPAYYISLDTLHESEVNDDEPDIKWPNTEREEWALRVFSFVYQGLGPTFLNHPERRHGARP